MTNNLISPELLEKYLAGQCTEEEARIVENWYTTQKGEKKYLSSISELDRQMLQEDTLNNIRKIVGVSFNQAAVIPQKVAFGRNRFVQIGIAASLLIVFLFVWQFTSIHKTDVNPVSTDIVFDELVVMPPSDMVVFINKEAKLVKHLLPDGTRIWLHPNAELSYPKIFANNSRQVTFVGEGFFDVAHDKSRPFLIQSDKMQVRVLGTKFNVKALPKQALFQVSVVSGSVAVRSVATKGTTDNKTVVLKPQQQALFEVATNKLTAIALVPQLKKEIYEPITINFEDTPIREVAQQLERKFNIHIQLADNALSKCLLKADFNNKSLPNILELLCASLDATYSMSGDTLILKGEGCE